MRNVRDVRYLRYLRYLARGPPADRTRATSSPLFLNAWSVSLYRYHLGITLGNHAGITLAPPPAVASAPSPDEDRHTATCNRDE